MKKIFAVLIVGLMTVSIAACNTAPASQNSQIPNSTPAVSSQVSATESSDDSSIEKPLTPESQAESAPEFQVSSLSGTENFGPKFIEGFKNVLNSDRFYLDMSLSYSYSESTSVIMNIVSAADSGKLYFKMTSNNKEAIVLLNDDGMFAISPETKQYVEVPVEQQNSMLSSLSDTTSEIFDFSEFKYIDSGSEDYNGKTYDYETYKNDEDGDDRVKIYFEGTKPVYMVQEDNSQDDDSDDFDLYNMQTVVTINEITSEVDSSLFEIPSGYEKKLTDEIFVDDDDND